MKAIVWGAMGSLPRSLKAEEVRSKVFRALEAARNRDLKSAEDIERFMDSELPFAVRETYGGNTSCVEIRSGDENEFVLLDAGSGLRDFSGYVMNREPGPCRFHIFLSHLHWDHLQGFPFFYPAYLEGNRVDIYACHADMQRALQLQQNPPYFPIKFNYLQGDIAFHQLDLEKEYEISGFKVRAIEQDHPGKSFGYVFEKDGKKIGYSTDSEHRERPNYEESPLSEFFSRADLLIFDAQYSLVDSIHTKESWGHSSNVVGVEFAIKNKIKHLCLFHSEPTHGDDTLDKALAEARKYARIFDDSHDLRISLGFDGLEIEVD